MTPTLLKMGCSIILLCYIALTITHPGGVTEHLSVEFSNTIIRHFCHTHYLAPDQFFTSLLWARPFTKPLRWRLILHSCSALLQNLVWNSGETQCLEEVKQQAEVSVYVPYPPLEIVNSVPFCLFSLYLYPLSAPFLNPLSSPSPPSLLSLLINSLSS